MSGDEYLNTHRVNELEKQLYKWQEFTIFAVVFSLVAIVVSIVSVCLIVTHGHQDYKEKTYKIVEVE